MQSTFVLQAASTLADGLDATNLSSTAAWNPLSNFTTTAATTLITDASSTNSALRYYRAGSPQAAGLGTGSALATAR
jgi:hypothetical protein